MSRNAIAQILLAASISFTACGGGSKSSDSTTTPSAQNEQAPVPGEAVPSQTTAGTTGTTTGTEAVPGVTTGDSTSGQTPSSDRQPVSGTTSDTSGMGTPGSTSGTTSGTAGSTSGTTGSTSGSATGTSDTTSSGTAGATSGTADTSGTTSGAASAAMTEATIFGALGAVNQHEIEVSQLALDKAKNKDVKKFAKMMVDQHKQLQATGDKTAKKLSITPEDNADITAMKEESRTAVEKLRGLEGAEFDKAYMDQMVQDHEKVLTMIDNQIMPAAASNDQIQSMLKTARPKIESHLAQARKLQAKVGGGATTKM